MTKEELVTRLRDIEWDDFEVKAAKSELPKNIWETVSAFSNCSGGWIVLGVKQFGKSFEVSGVDNIEKLEQDFFGTLRSKKFNVPLFATLHRYEIDSKNIIAFYLSSSEVKPVYFGSLENTFIRMGSGDQRATQQEIMSMIRDQSFGVQSQKSIPDTNIDMLNREALADFRGEVRHWGLVSHLDSVSDEEFCKGVGITDHFSPRRSCIHVFDDRIEFLNPGGMPMPLDVMENSFESQPRNPIIAKLFRLAHLSENLGYGLRKLKHWQEITGRPMHIETTINSVKVTFDFQTRESGTSDVVKNVAKNVAKNLTERQQQIITLISKNPQTTRAEIASAIGVSAKTIERELATLSKIVCYVGSKKGGHWEIITYGN